MINNFFTTTIGSDIWGMRHAKSDTDLFRVYVASTEEILKGTWNMKSKFTQKDNIDIALHELGKVVEQLLKGNFNFLVGTMSPIVVGAHNPLFLHELREMVRENISKNCYHSIHGLAVHNYKKYIVSGKDDSERRCNKILRVLQFGKDVLDTQPHVINGRIVFNTKFAFKPFSGGVPDDIEAWIYQLDEAYKYSQLPEKPDEEVYRDWLYKIRLYEWELGNE